MDNPVVIVCSIAIVALGVAFTVFKLRDRREYRQALETGESLTGYIIQANSELFKPGKMDLPASVLISFPGPHQAQEADLARLLGKIHDLRENISTRPVDKKVARIAYEESHRPSRRTLLPMEFTDGLEVYCVNVVILRRLLPSATLDQSTIQCKALPGESGQIFMVGS